jgi:hypothetical protein
LTLFSSEVDLKNPNREEEEEEDGRVCVTHTLGFDTEMNQKCHRLVNLFPSCPHHSPPPWFSSQKMLFYFYFFIFLFLQFHLLIGRAEEE